MSCRSLPKSLSPNPPRTSAMSDAKANSSVVQDDPILELDRLSAPKEDPHATALANDVDAEEKSLLSLQRFILVFVYVTYLSDSHVV